MKKTILTVGIIAMALSSFAQVKIVKSVDEMTR